MREYLDAEDIFQIAFQTITAEQLFPLVKQAEIMADAIKLAEKNNGSPALNVRELLKLASAHAEELARGNVSIGTKSLLDEVSQKCYVGIGLIERTVTE